MEQLLGRTFEKNVSDLLYYNECARDKFAMQMNAMTEELERFPEGVTFTRPEGGLFIWVELPEALNALELLPKAIEKRVAYVPGTHFFADGGHLNTLRLNFSMAEPETIRKGLALLQGVLDNA